ncbi:hypothetical protein OF83DRAFT_1173291 [Amylostereum chailletii]|nr:hypothetical protein OF83DRAFT_1173291 [Amylostereum chailletii]
MNKTDQHLRNTTGTHANYGEWEDVPDLIEAGGRASFRLKDDWGIYGSDGVFDFSVRDDEEMPRASLSACQACPWGTADNTVSLNAPHPEALYVASFRASVDGGSWTDSYVEPGGHPINVEYTFEYQRRKRYRFQLVHIEAVSDHPVRNSRDELIVGQHALWDRDNAPTWADGTRGSFQPNVFAYDFTSSVAAAGALDVTVRPLDLELTGAECLLFGIVGGRRVFQSDYFFFEKALADKTVQVHVVVPKTSARPFSWNANVEWGMELRLSDQGVECVEPRSTSLELYWIATSIHRTFQNGIPVGFMRDVLTNNAKSTSSDLSATQVAATSFAFYEDMTRHAFKDFHKIYDTAAGASAFGMSIWGGIFWESYYRAADISGEQGTLYRHVNCMDQAAMLELSCSFLGGFSSTSWLAQQPFGYINPTYLVGVNSDTPILVNNPFFGTEWARAYIDRDDPARTMFGCHVYVGHSKPFVPGSDGIYDACGGPHVGSEDVAQFLTSSIDTQTNLYQTTHTHPGTVGNVAQGDGVTGIDGNYWVPPAQARHPDVALPEALAQLTATRATRATSVTHVDWAHVPAWLPSVLGDSWEVRFGRVTVGTATARAFWHIADTSGEPLRVHVCVESVVAEDGTLDLVRSAAAIRDRVADIVTSTDYDPERLWMRGALDDLGDYSMQYADGFASGRVVVVAGNIVVDIAGMSSSAALRHYARTLLEHTVQRNGPPLALPVLHSGPVRTTGHSPRSISNANEVESNVITVEGVHSRFTVSFKAEGVIVAAGATCEGPGILLDKYAIEEIGNEEGHVVDFRFVTREVGRHLVHVHFADSKTMVSATRDIIVEVV